MRLCHLRISYSVSQQRGHLQPIWTQRSEPIPLLVGSLFTAAPGFPIISSGQETLKTGPQVQPRSLGSTYARDLSLSPPVVPSVVRLPHPQSLCLELFPNSSYVWIGDPLSSVLSISGAPEPPGPPHASVISSPRP